MVERVKIKRKIERVKIFRLEPKVRVQLSYNPNQQGTIIKVGVEVSEVKWDNGCKQIFEPNNFLKPLENEEA